MTWQLSTATTLPLHAFLQQRDGIRGCIQKFPDWPPGARMQMVQLPATRCSCIAILWISLVSSVAITLCAASQRAFTFVSIHFITDSVRKRLNTPSRALWNLGSRLQYVSCVHNVRPRWVLPLSPLICLLSLNTICKSTTCPIWSYPVKCERELEFCFLIRSLRDSAQKAE
jgi:hypothetical protein